MNRTETGLFCCPHCGQPLGRENKSCRCPSGHSFDLAAEGYLHLLPANRMRSHQPGDDKQMVAARARFLEKGYYAPLRQELARLCLQYAPCPVSLLDLGCGEGYYTRGMVQALAQAGREPWAAGVDISKAAVRLAAKQDKATAFAVASVFHLPVADGRVDLAVNCFSPLCVEEILRVLRPGGRFLYVVPGAEHLWGLKSAVYQNPYPNAQQETPYPGLEYCEISRVKADILLTTQEDIDCLFHMTPYFWKTSREDAEKLQALDTLATPIAFDIHVYSKL